MSLHSPGEDAQGNPHRISFFHAFYVMSYTATTIGFGDLPHTFTERRGRATSGRRASSTGCTAGAATVSRHCGR
jgi:hypothetical protein